MNTQPQHRCWAEIDLAALERNLGRIRAALPAHIRYVAVVKADAYGHGLPQTVARLMQCGADAFAVASIREAARIREMGSGWPILVLGALLPGEELELVANNLIATLSTEDEVRRLERAAEKAGAPARVHLKIDTGMGRLGVWHEEVSPLLELLMRSQTVALEGVFTHFSSADTDPDYTALQRQRFIEALGRTGLADAAKKSGLLIHADNSAGLESFSADSPFNAVRVGLLQFGHPPLPGSLLGRIQPEPVLSLHTHVGLIKTLPAGTPVSYGQTHRLNKRSRLAVLTAGYADGIPTAAGNSARVLIGGRRHPVVGRITMDQTIVDITGADGIQPGAPATFFGSRDGAAISVAEFSEWTASIPYETLCRISKRVPRIYRTSRT